MVFVCDVLGIGVKIFCWWKEEFSENIMVDREEMEYWKVSIVKIRILGSN